MNRMIMLSVGIIAAVVAVTYQHRANAEGEAAPTVDQRLATCEKQVVSLQAALAQAKKKTTESPVGAYDSSSRLDLQKKK